MVSRHNSLWHNVTPLFRGVMSAIKPVGREWLDEASECGLRQAMSCRGEGKRSGCTILHWVTYLVHQLGCRTRQAFSRSESLDEGKTS